MMTMTEYSDSYLSELASGTNFKKCSVRNVFASGLQLCRFDEDQKAFIIEVDGSEEIKLVNFNVEIQGIVNPSTTRDWGWSMKLEKYGKVYATSNQISIPLDEPRTVQTIDNIDIGLNLANTGEQSTYTFKIPRLKSLTEGITDLYIEFPNGVYDETLGGDISCSTEGISLTCYVLSNRRIIIQNVDQYYVKTPMLNIDVSGIVQPKIVGSFTVDFTYTFALGKSVGMQVTIPTSLDLFGQAKTLILNAVYSEDTNVNSQTDYVFEFYPLTDLPSSPNAGQVVYQIIPPKEYSNMRGYYLKKELSCSIKDVMLLSSSKSKEELECYINQEGNFIISTSFASIPGMTMLSIRISIMNPFDIFDCLENQANVFRIQLKNPSAN